MTRYYFYAFLGWMAGTFAVAKGQTTTVCLSPSSSSGGQHVASADDWQVPTFIVQGNNPAMPRTQGTQSTKSRAHVASSSRPVTTPVQLDQPAPVSHPAAVTFCANRSAGPAIVVDHSAKKAPSGFGHAVTHAVVSAVDSVSETVSADGGRLARLTAYWAGEGDYYTGRLVSSTGVRLHSGLCAVDPNIIPYGSVVVIPGMGQFLAVDTGSAVISRVAAREAGRTAAERHALVIDLFFDHSRDGERFAAEEPKYASISWWTPSSNSHEAQAARSVFADEDWNKITSKQL